LTGRKGGQEPPHQPGRAQAPASPPAGPRFIGPRRFWLSCVLAFPKDGGGDHGWWGETGRSTMFGREPRGVQPMGKSQIPGVGRPLLFSPESFRGRTRGLGFRSTSGNQVLSLAGGRRSSSAERQRGSSEAESVSLREEWVCEGVAAGHQSLLPRGQRRGSLLVSMHLDAPVPPVISTKPRHQGASLPRRLAPPTRAISPIRGGRNR